MRATVNELQFHVTIEAEGGKDAASLPMGRGGRGGGHGGAGARIDGGCSAAAAGTNATAAAESGTDEADGALAGSAAYAAWSRLGPCRWWRGGLDDDTDIGTKGNKKVKNGSKKE